MIVDLDVEERRQGGVSAIEVGSIDVADDLIELGLVTGFKVLSGKRVEGEGRGGEGRVLEVHGLMVFVI